MREEQHEQQPGRQQSGEHAFLERLRARLPAAPAGSVWAGDDAAVLDQGLLFATDALVAGVHFDLAWSSAQDVGWKALSVNLSDLAAMAGTPLAAVVAVVVPPEPSGLADAVLEGLAGAADAYRCPLVGGDTTAGSQLVVSVAVLGKTAPPGPILRSGARPGDTVFVTGPLGGPAHALEMLAAGGETPAGLLDRLRRPVPRLSEGRAAASGGANAMIDISDGLAADAGHLCEESGVGVRIDSSAVPLASGASLDDALTGGDDYELCFTAANEGAVTEAFAAAGLVAPTPIGRITEEPTRLLVDGDGADSPLSRGGWDHVVP